jgi:L-iditol 2-dehydrogenase
LGCGISGLLHIGLARALGAGGVFAADTIPFRLEKAKEMGAHFCLDAGDDMLSLLRRDNAGRLADLVIVCFEGFLPLALRAVERGGTVLIFSGASEGAVLPIPVNDLFWRTEITLTSSYAGAPYDCETALRLIAAGSVPVGKTITHRIPLEEGPGGFQAVCAPMRHRCVKVIIHPHGGVNCMEHA